MAASWESHLSDVKRQIRTSKYDELQNKRLKQRPKPPREYCTSLSMPFNTRFNDTCKMHCDAIEFDNLQREIVIVLNEGKPLDCYSSTLGYITVLAMTNADIKHLNSLTYQLLCLANINYGHAHYLHLNYNRNESTSEHFPLDRYSKLFNKSGEQLLKTNYIKKFSAKVAVAVQGIRVLDQFNIYPSITIYQVKVIDEEDVHARVDDCIFTD